MPPPSGWSRDPLGRPPRRRWRHAGLSFAHTLLIGALRASRNNHQWLLRWLKSPYLRGYASLLYAASAACLPSLRPNIAVLLVGLSEVALSDCPTVRLSDFRNVRSCVPNHGPAPDPVASRAETVVAESEGAGRTE